MDDCERAVIAVVGRSDHEDDVIDWLKEVTLSKGDSRVTIRLSSKILYALVQVS